MVEQRMNPDLYLIDENHAILNCYYEFMDILKRIFGGCHRSLVYYLLFDKNPEPCDEAYKITIDFPQNFEEERKKDEDELDIDETKEKIYKKNVIFGQFITFLNKFSEYGGF